MNELFSLAVAQLAAEINLLHEEAEKHANMAVVYAARCGDKLIQAKSQVEHGQWMNWLEANCRVKSSQAERYMRIAREMPELLDPNSYPGTNLPGLRHAVALLTADEDVKAEVQERLDAGEKITVKEIEALKRQAKAEREARERLATEVEQLQQCNRVLQINLSSSARELENAQTNIDRLAEQKSREAVEKARGELKAESARVEKLRKKLAEAEASIEVGVRAGLSRRQGELNELERDIRQAEQSLAGFRQKLREVSSAEYENQRLNIDAEKVLREVVTFATTLNLIECEEIYPINWELLGQIVTGGDSLCALITRFKETHRRTEKPVLAA